MSRSIYNVSYTTAAFADNLDDIIYAFMEATQNVKVNSLLGRGLSGALVIPAIARVMGIPFAIMRKNDENSHGRAGMFEGTLTDNWVFVDDFIDTGRTFQECCNNIADMSQPIEAWGLDSIPLACTGLFQYQRIENGLIAPDPNGLVWIPSVYRTIIVNVMGGELDSKWTGY
jgi:hypothetical protein